MKSPKKRIEHVIKLRAELSALDVGSVNFEPRVFVYLVSLVKMMTSLIEEVGMEPEREVFHIGHIHIGNDLIRKGLVRRSRIFRPCLGVPWGMEVTTTDMVCMPNTLPGDALWYALGVGSQHLRIAAASILMGGHARVKFENNIYLKPGNLASSNAPIVAMAADLAVCLRREVATPDDARRILGI